MKISKLLEQDKLSLSFEVFPPKTDSSFDSVRHATEEIAKLAMYLLSEEAQMVCGETVVLDGAYAIR